MTRIESAFVASCLLGVLACGKPNAESPQTRAECAAIRAFFDDAQTKIIDQGLCDTAVDVTRCPAHQALEEALIASLKENRCQSKTN